MSNAFKLNELRVLIEERQSLSVGWGELWKSKVGGEVGVERGSMGLVSEGVLVLREDELLLYA